MAKTPFKRLQRRPIVEELERRESPTSLAAASLPLLGGLAEPESEAEEESLPLLVTEDPADEGEGDQSLHVTWSTSPTDTTSGTHNVSANTTTDTDQEQDSMSPLDRALLPDPFANPLSASEEPPEFVPTVGSVLPSNPTRSAGGGSGGSSGGSGGGSSSGGGGGGSGATTDGNTMEPPVGGGQVPVIDGSTSTTDAGTVGSTEPTPDSPQTFALASPSSGGGSNDGSTRGDGDRGGPAPTPTPGAVGEPGMRFEINRGQTDHQVDYLARGSNYTLFVTPNQAVFSLAKPDGALAPRGDRGDNLTQTRFFDVVAFDVVGGDQDAKIVGRDVLTSRSNYFTGTTNDDWLIDIPNFATVEVQDVYDGIDMRYYSTEEGQLEFDFIVHPGANSQIIELNFQGTQDVQLDEQGHLQLRTANGELTSKAPIIYQTYGRDKQFRSGRYKKVGDTRVRFEVDSYDGSRPLVLDPVLSWSTFLGGSGNDEATDIAVAGDGSVYVTGYTASTDFPTINPFTGTHQGVDDVFVSRLSADGQDLVYSTYLGGSGQDQAYALDLDAAGNAYVTGETLSSDFPTTTGAYREIGQKDAFVVKLNSTGDALHYSTLLGDPDNATGSDRGNDIVVDALGQAYVIGTTPADAVGDPFPATVGAFQTTYGGGVSDAFVTALNQDGTALRWSSFLGGDDDEAGYSIDIDSSGNVFLTGEVGGAGTVNLFPVTTGAVQTTYGGGDSDVFVSQVQADGSLLTWSSFLGGSGTDRGYAVQIDRDGNTYLTGDTTSTNFPTASAYQSSLSGSQDAFVAKINDAGSTLTWSTYFGGDGDETAYGLGLDDQQQVFITGSTDSGALDNFPLQNAFQSTYGGGASDGFLSQLAADGQSLLVSSYHGGSSDEESRAVAVDIDGNAYLTGWTESTDFPTVAPYQSSHGGARDAFITNVNMHLPAPVITAITPDTGDSATDFITFSQAITLLGTAPANSTVTIFRPTIGVVGSTTADANGDWTFDYSGTALPEGTHAFLAQATLSGQTSDWSNQVLVNIDLTGPTVLVTTHEESLVAPPETLSRTPKVRVTARDRFGISETAPVVSIDVDLDEDNLYEPGEIDYVTNLVLGPGSLSHQLPVLPPTPPTLFQDSYSIRARVTDLAGNQGTSADHIYSVYDNGQWSILQADVLSHAPFQGDGLSQVGNVSVSHLLDMDLSPGVGQGGFPALVYNSSSVDVRPVFQVMLQSDNTQSLPNEILVDFIWNGQIISETFDTTYGNPDLREGDTLTFAFQVGPIAETGAYDWSVAVTIPKEDPEPDILLSDNGTAYVRVEDDSLYGSGWTLSNVNRLVHIFDGPANEYDKGVMWLDGVGGWRYFAPEGSTSPYYSVEDGGVLVRHPDDTYTYTAPTQYTIDFDSEGRQLKWTSADQEKELSFTWSGDVLTSVQAIDGSTTTLTYDGTSGLLDKIESPGSRIFDVTIIGTDLRDITDPDGGLREFSYDGNHRLVNETRGSADELENSWGYDSVTGMANQITWGNSTSPTIWSNIRPTAAVGLGGLTNERPHARSTNPRTYEPVVYTDLRGRTVTTVAPNGPTTFTPREESGQISSIYDPIGRWTLFEYDDWGHLTKVTFPDGNHIAYSYDATWHQLISVVDERNHGWGYTLDVKGHVATETNPLNETTYFTWNNGLLETITDAENKVTTLTHDTNRRLKTTTDVFGTTENFYDTNGHIDYVRDAKLRDWQYGYDQQGRLLTWADPTGGTINNVYNDAGLLQSTTDREGHITKYDYDDHNRGLVEIAIEASGSNVARTTLSQFDIAGHTEGVRNPRGYWHKFTLDPVGQVLETIDPLGHTTRNEFDLAGQVIADRDKLGFWFDYDYHDRGWLTHVTHPDATFVQTVYDESGNPTFDYDELGAANVTFYDELHRVSSQMDREANIFFYDYYADGTQKEITNARGYVTHYDYDWITLQVTVQEAYNTPRQRQTVTNLDATGNAYLAVNDLLFADYVNVFEQRDWLQRTEDELQHGLEYEYTNNGQVKKITDDLQHSSHYDHDALGRQTKAVDANGHIQQWVFNAHNAVVTTIDGEGHAHTYVYDGLDRLIYSIDAEGGITKYTYNAEGHLLTLTDPVGNLTQWRNNWRGLAVEITDPRGKTTYKEYDAKGRLTKVTDRNGRVREYEYYANDWLKREIWKDDQGLVVNTRDFIYNEHGQLLSAGDNNGTYSFSYDELGRRISQIDVHGLALNYSYDSIDRLTQVTDSLGGTRDYEHYDNGMSKVVKFIDTNGTALRWDYAITVRNEVDTITRFSDVAATNQIGHTDYVYEPNGLIQTISHRDSTGAVIDEFNYQYNADNQVTQETSTLGPTRNFDYDATHQLISENGTNFNWDRNGNPTYAGHVIGAGNRLESNGTWNYEYDDEGNLTKKTKIATGEEWTYGYDTVNHLVEVHRKANSTAPVDLQVNFKYDVLDNRIEKSVDPDGVGPQPVIIEQYAYEDGNAWADLDSTGFLTTRRLYLGAIDSLFARIGGTGDVAWYLEDRQGSVRDLLDGNGTLQDHIDYEAFGNVTNETNPSFGDRYKYTKREWDAEIALQYNRARYYDPEMKRWISQDPLGFGAGDNNLYRYVSNSPTNATDPSGKIYSYISDWVANSIASHRWIKGSWAETPIRAVQGINRSTDILRKLVDGAIVDPIQHGIQQRSVEDGFVRFLRNGISIIPIVGRIQSGLVDYDAARHRGYSFWGAVGEAAGRNVPFVSSAWMMYEAWTGQNVGGAFHGQSLSVDERWQRGGDAVLDAVFSFVGIKIGTRIARSWMSGRSSVPLVEPDASWVRQSHTGRPGPLTHTGRPGPQPHTGRPGPRAAIAPDTQVRPSAPPTRQPVLPPGTPESPQTPTPQPTGQIPNRLPIQIGPGPTPEEWARIIHAGPNHPIWLFVPVDKRPVPLTPPTPPTPPPQVPWWRFWDPRW